MKIIKLLGAGSIGKVYLVEIDQKLFAFKELNDKSNFDRVTQEVTALAALNHNNLVKTFKIISQGSRFGYLMEYVPAGDLLVLIKNAKSISQALAFKISTEIAAGLDYLSQQQIIHRDLKPQNILLTDDQQAKITDFGMARMLGANTLSQPGLLFGTAAYVSPEFVELGDCDHRADVFALGVITYELFNRRLPWRGKTVIDILRNRSDSSIAEHEKNVHPRIQAVINKALSLSVFERYQSARDFLSDFNSCQDCLEKTGFFSKFGF